MKIAIIGSRKVGNINFAEEIAKHYQFGCDDIIISGGAKGIDTLAAEFAKTHKLGLIELCPDYEKKGRAAIFIRNRAIIDNSDLVIAFWDGISKGTKYTLDYARKKGMPIKVIPI